MLCCRGVSRIAAASSPGWLRPAGPLGRPALFRGTTWLPCKQEKRGGHRLVAAAQQVDDQAAAQSAAAPPPPPDKAAGRPAPHMECIGTGMEASCTMVTEGPEHVAVASPEEEAQAALEAEQHAGE